jgi:hypothetical protein
MLLLAREFHIGILAAVLAIGVAAGAEAATAQAPVQLKAIDPLSADLAAFPRLLAAPGDRAAERINQALERRDRQLQSAVKDCRSNSDRPAEAMWSRVISVAMRGPRYLSLVADDSWDCGGAHGDFSLLVLVYDLNTGSPVNWARLLPASPIQGTSLDSAGDGTQVGVVSSRALLDLYLKARSSDPKDPLDPECRDVLSDSGLKFNIWPDAKGDGLALETEGLPHAVAACGADSVTVATSTLRKVGVQPALLDAIDTAHARGWYGPASQ